jgi:hypothetical protein
LRSSRTAVALRFSARLSKRLAGAPTDIMREVGSLPLPIEIVRNL